MHKYEHGGDVYQGDAPQIDFSININPLRLRMNEGQRYAITDSYTNLAVDFQLIILISSPAV